MKIYLRNEIVISSLSVHWFDGTSVWQPFCGVLNLTVCGPWAAARRIGLTLAQFDVQTCRRDG
jgi:hypothetical protein